MDRQVSAVFENCRRDFQLYFLLSGTGKTTSILACARKLYNEKQFGSMVLELNASDDRGIGIVRGQILDFASTKTIFASGFKLIILDEADAMTNDAQNALRRGNFKYLFSSCITQKKTNFFTYFQSSKNTLITYDSV